MPQSKIKTVLVTGGAGYVGSILVPKLLKQGYRVKVLDLYLYEPAVFATYRGENLLEIKGDLRDQKLLAEHLRETDAIIHLASISNDPSFELNPQLGKSINYDGMITLIEAARRAKIKRFVFASTSSVYGVKSEENVTENLSLDPLTDYSKYKALGEKILMEQGAPYFTAVAIRSATVCGYSPRMRFDLSVNILTNHAWNKGVITVIGGEQKRPNIHIQDITDLYVKLLDYPDQQIHQKIYNAGGKNHTIAEIADIVKKAVEQEQRKTISIERKPPGDDRRSYHISSEKIRQELGFSTRRTIDDAVRDLCVAFRQGQFNDSLRNPVYFNVQLMQKNNLI